MITEKIRPQAVETQVGFVLVGAAVAGTALLFYRFPMTIAGPLTVVLLIATVAAIEDVRTRRLRNLYTGAIAAAGVTVAVVYQVTGWRNGLWPALLAGAAWFLVLLIEALPEDSLSAGDVKLAGALGIWMGWIGWPAAFFGLLLVHGVMALVLLSARIRGVHRVPLGPAIVAGVLVALLVVGG